MTNFLTNRHVKVEQYFTLGRIHKEKNQDILKARRGSLTGTVVGLDVEMLTRTVELESMSAIGQKSTERSLLLYTTLHITVLYNTFYTLYTLVTTLFTLFTTFHLVHHPAH